MQKQIASVIIFFILILGIPALIVKGCSKQQDREKGESLGGPEVKVYFHGEKEIRSVPLEDYLIGVVAAEMPASFEIEALKAQAIAARTYTLARIGRENLNHPGADICTNHVHAQAWISWEQMEKNWGTLSFWSNYRKIRLAVTRTKGQVLIYRGELIDPLYHAACGGRGTENSEDVWQNGLSYLRGVDCYDSPKLAAAQGLKVVTFNEIDKAFGTDLASKVTKWQHKSPFIVAERTSRGRVKRIKIEERTFDGGQFRSKLGLKSTDFTWKIKGDTVRFTTHGNGHAVGLCQYGADAMSKEGKTYRQILAHYYHKTSLAKIKSD